MRGKKTVGYYLEVSKSVEPSGPGFVWLLVPKLVLLDERVFVYCALVSHLPARGNG